MCSVCQQEKWAHGFASFRNSEIHLFHRFLRSLSQRQLSAANNWRIQSEGILWVSKFLRIRSSVYELHYLTFSPHTTSMRSIMNELITWFGVTWCFTDISLVRQTLPCPDWTKTTSSISTVRTHRQNTFLLSKIKIDNWFCYLLFDLDWLWLLPK